MAPEPLPVRAVRIASDGLRLFVPLGAESKAIALDGSNAPSRLSDEVDVYQRLVQFHEPTSTLLGVSLSSGWSERARVELSGGRLRVRSDGAAAADLDDASTSADAPRQPQRLVFTEQRIGVRLDFTADGGRCLVPEGSPADQRGELCRTAQPHARIPHTRSETDARAHSLVQA